MSPERLQLHRYDSVEQADWVEQGRNVEDRSMAAYTGKAGKGVACSTMFTIA